MLKLIEIENVFPLVHEELIICEDITNNYLEEHWLSYHLEKLGLLVLLQIKCSIW